MRTAIIAQNLKYSGCANTITTKLSQLDTLSEILVDTETLTVSFAPKNPKDELTVKRKLKTLRHPSVENTNRIISKATYFVSCATGKIK